MERRTITVTGRGGLHIVPDVTRVELQIKSIRVEYIDCYNLAKDNNAALARIMQELGVDTKLPKTTGLDIERLEHNIYDKNGKFSHTEFLGYELSQKIKIDLGMDNELLGKLVRSIGKNLTDVEISIGYTVKDQRPAKLKMLHRAVKDAKEKAEVMTKAADCKLGKVLSITYAWQNLEIYSQARSIHSEQEAAVCSKEGLDITPDDLAVSDEATVVWSVR